LIEKKRLFQKYKAMEYFSLLQKCIEKAQKRNRKKSRILGWAFVIGGGDIKKEKIISNWGIFLLFFFFTRIQ